MELKEIKEYSEWVRGAHGARNTMFDAMEAMFLMAWGEEADASRRHMKSWAGWGHEAKSRMSNLKLTISPDARNRALGVMRLLTASDAIFRVPFDENSPDAQAASEGMERMAQAIWTAAGRARGDPVLYDIVRSAVLYSEFHIYVTSTADIALYSKGMGKAQEKRAHELAETTPYLIDVGDPRQGYPEFDGMGLSSFYRQSQMTCRELCAKFGTEAKKIADRKGGQFMPVVVNDYWDMETRCVWVEGEDSPLILESHGLPFIPVVAGIVEGGRLFSQAEYQRQPFLYSLWHSGLWERQNLSLTVLYTMLFSIGANPMFIEKMSPSGGEVELDFSEPGGRVRVPPGADFFPMGSKGAIDPSIMQGLEIAKGLLDESTIYGQVLGEPLGSSASYSMTALLHQAGRLPLVTLQKKISWGVADVMKMCLKWQQERGEDGRAYSDGRWAELAVGDMPEYFELEAQVEIDLPQDKLQLAQMAQMISGGQDPLVSKRWARENVLQVGQSDDMQEEIWGEMAGSAEFAKYMAMMQQQMAGGGGPMAAGGGGMPVPDGPPGGMPAEMMGQGGGAGEMSPEMLQAMMAQGGGPGGMPGEMMGGAMDGRPMPPMARGMAPGDMMRGGMMGVPMGGGNEQ